MANEILPFGIGAGSNVMTQADYEALAARVGGFSSGVAKSEQLNKIWRQSAFVASVLAQFIANRSAEDVLDDGDTANLLTNLELALKTYVNGHLPVASITTAGISQLSNSITSTSETLAATSKAVKTVNDGIPAFLTGVIGTSRNAKMSVTAASATATFTADELIVQTALGGRQYKLSSFSKTINLASTGAGGMDTGTVPAAGFVALYAIYNPTTQVSALLAVNATSVLAPEVYGGANMPAGYTASALVSVWRTASSQFTIGHQLDRNVSFPRVSILTATAGTTPLLPINMPNYLPINAKYCSVDGAGATSTNGLVGMAFASSIS
ncbi:phage tail protein, partial [Yersinia massiliensis]|uniref:phage tail protein n=1 Tax=Yersinia massiliensis TaxID=419257 RepID=UPI0011A96BE5